LGLRLKLFFCSLALAGCLLADQALTNQRVGDLIAAGVSANEVIRIIGAAHTVNFDLRPGSTDNLLKAGVPQDVVKAMAAKEAGLSVQASEKIEPRTKLAAAIPAERASKPRVFVEDANDSWSYTASRHFGQGSTHPQTVEIIKTFAESCPGVIVTDKLDRADFRVRFERESNKGLIRRDNKFAAFTRDGDLVFADSTRSLGNAVRAFCAAIQK
jgi:hypothetical protein